MKPRTLVFRGLTYYWRTHIAVILGVATAVAVLAGALMVGDSVRGSLQDIVLQRLGRTDFAILANGFVRDELSRELAANRDFPAHFSGICPLIMTQGVASLQSGDRRAGSIRVYGVDDRFWQFHGLAVKGPADRQALLSPALAAELGANPGDTILVRVQRPSDIPLDSLFSLKDDAAHVVRAQVGQVLPRESLGEFSLQAEQGSVRAVFLSLTQLQQEMDIHGRVNAMLASNQPQTTADNKAVLEGLIRNQVQVEDLGLRVRTLETAHALVLEAEGGILNDSKAKIAEDVASRLALRPQKIFTYLANRMISGVHEVPYSLVTAIDLPVLGPSDPPSIVLNSWAAQNLAATTGGSVTLEYYVWEEPGRLVTRMKDFRVAGVVPVSAGDRTLAPSFPGITDASALSDWNPPFPIDLRRVRPIDEAYWKQYGTTPKAFVSLEVGRQLWASRYGSMTSIRFSPPAGGLVAEYRENFETLLRSSLDPLATDVSVQPVRAQSLDASRGATDFGEYFVYFSFFLVASALLLTGLFFRLSVEQRVREVGLLRAMGFVPGAVRKLFLAEGLVLSLLGALAGIAGGIAYAYLIVIALRTWWVGAVGTTALSLHVSKTSLVAGATGGVVAAMVCVWITLRGFADISERGLLAGQIGADVANASVRRKFPLSFGSAVMTAVLGLLLVTGGWTAYLAQAASFFGAAAAFLISLLCFARFRLGTPTRRVVRAATWKSVIPLGFRNASYRPTRSIVAMATIASAVFILMSVEAFRKDASAAVGLKSGVGGYDLLVRTIVPIVHDPASPEGREALGLADMDQTVNIEPFRVRPGDDASCLNLYIPKNPRIMAPSEGFIEAGRFDFKTSLASTEAERVNPWILLRREEPDGAIPVIADANSMAYVLHRKLGEDIVITSGQHEVRLRLVAALEDSIFQGELLMSTANFVRLFPEVDGYKFLLVQTAPEKALAVVGEIENALTDFGADAMLTAERLAEFHRVENTYISTFQMLGGLGLLLGTAGLGAVLLRNVLERRQELALLRALGYGRVHFLVMTIAENALILLGGLLAGVLCAFVAIVPVLRDRGGNLPGMSLLALCAVLFIAGLLTSLLATAAALRSALVSALKSE